MALLEKQSGKVGKMKPLCFDTCAHVYRIMGEVVADAFSVGKALV